VLDLLISDGGLAGDLLARTAKTARVQEMVQLSLSPVLLLGAIGAVLNVVNGRLNSIMERIERLETKVSTDSMGGATEQLPVLRRRQQYAHIAINLGTAAALIICGVVALMFISAFVRPALGTYVAVSWIVAMALVFCALLLFLLETQLATSSVRGHRRPPPDGPHANARDHHTS
jgi:hypothetical protein